MCAMESKVLKKREEIKETDKWSVNEVYPSDEAWEKEYKELQEEAPKLKDFEGKLKNGEVLIEYLELNEKISRKAEKIYVYAHLKSDEDTSNS
ncbi:oligoendopeptidase F, partial [Clostridium saudiense]|nr:oligoendopeptidase F [Clostridium saudiense]